MRSPLADGRVLVSAAAEDTPNAVDDGPVVGSALALLDDDGVLATVALPGSGPGPTRWRAWRSARRPPDGLRLLAVIDADDPAAASELLTLRLRW